MYTRDQNSRMYQVLWQSHTFPFPLASTWQAQNQISAEKLPTFQLYPFVQVYNKAKGNIKQSFSFHTFASKLASKRMLVDLKSL